MNETINELKKAIFLQTINELKKAIFLQIIKEATTISDITDVAYAEEQQIHGGISQSFIDKLECHLDTMQSAIRELKAIQLSQKIQML